MKQTKTKRSYKTLAIIAAFGAVSTGGLASVAEWVGPTDPNSYYPAVQLHSAASHYLHPAASDHYSDFWVIPLLFVVLSVSLAIHEFVKNRKHR